MEFIIKHYHEVEIGGEIHKTEEIEGKLIIAQDGKIEINIPKHTHNICGMHWGFRTNEVGSMKTNIDTEKGNTVIEQKHNHFISSYGDVFITSEGKYKVIVCEPDREESR